MKRSLIAYAVALVALSASLAGCNGGGDPTPSPTVTSSSPSASPSASASPSSSPSPSVSIPAEAMQQTPEGAVAFVKFYFDQVNAAWSLPDATLLPPLADEVCGTCDNYESTASQLLSSGTRSATPTLELLDVRAIDGAPLGQVFVAFTIHQLGAKVVNAEGATVSESPEKNLPTDATVIWTEGSWRMYAIARAS